MPMYFADTGMLLLNGFFDILLYGPAVVICLSSAFFLALVLNKSKKFAPSNKLIKLLIYISFFVVGALVAVLIDIQVAHFGAGFD